MKWVSSRGGREGAIKDPPFPQVWWVGKRGRRSEGVRETGWREKKVKYPVSGNWREVGEVVFKPSHPVNGSSSFYRHLREKTLLPNSAKVKLA